MRTLCLIATDDSLRVTPVVRLIRNSRLDEFTQCAERRHEFGWATPSFVGGSSVLYVAIGIVRTKAMPVLLGPAGVGLMGPYGSIADLARSIAGMGINSSGVRQIAEAVASGDTERMARTVAVLRRTSVVLGILGAVLLVVFS